MAVIHLSEVMEKIGRAATAWKLNPRDTNTLLLLGEEMLGMTESLVDASDINFFVKTEEKRFELHLVARAIISPEMKREFVDASSKKKNEMAKGLKGKIKSIMEDYFYISSNEMVLPLQYGSFEHGMGVYNMAWSMEEYLNSAPPEVQKDDWDGLERSILANLADEITIGANIEQVEMIVKKTFG